MNRPFNLHKFLIALGLLALLGPYAAGGTAPGCRFVVLEYKEKAGLPLAANRPEAGVLSWVHENLHIDLTRGLASTGSIFLTSLDGWRDQVDQLMLALARDALRHEIAIGEQLEDFLYRYVSKPPHENGYLPGDAPCRRALTNGFQFFDQFVGLVTVYSPEGAVEGFVNSSAADPHRFRYVRFSSVKWEGAKSQPLSQSVTGNLNSTYFPYLRDNRGNHLPRILLEQSEGEREDFLAVLENAYLYHQLIQLSKRFTLEHPGAFRQISNRNRPLQTPPALFAPRLF
jgi:hypothetical protein